MVAKPGSSLSLSAATWSEPGPWHDSQLAEAPTSDESRLARPCPPRCQDLNWVAWHSSQDSDPLKVATGCERGARGANSVASEIPSRVMTIHRGFCIVHLRRLRPAGAPPRGSSASHPQATYARSPKREMLPRYTRAPSPMVL